MIRSSCLLMLAVLLLVGFAWSAPPAAQKPFVVHEWGVWVIGKGSDGNSALCSPDELIAGLPAFVQKIKVPRQVLALPWEKPVIHFYGENGQAVTVKIETAEGYLSAYWPSGKINTRSRLEGGNPRKMNPGNRITETLGIEWIGKLQAAPEGKLGETPKDHWWSAVREVPSMYFVADKQCERFLFYEGTAKHEPAVTAKISADQLKLTNTDGNAAGEVMVIVSSGDKRYCRVLDSIKGGGDAAISKAQFLEKPVTEEQLLDTCRSQWQKFGMTDAEAKAIVQSWRPDLLHPWQVLVISRMPADVYEKMFPLTVTPKPDKLVRVGVVFDRLKGKACANIVPGLSDHIKDLQKQAKDEAKSKEAKVALDELGVGE